ncbi:programmed cell death protein, putative [Eimeria acervulina]|uniref:Programmed cell death protein, putative n=1 Tax=Eimeria acervulina TaxID=5801 RepID=U6GAE1_EIMAC|nr:programmed cell death protein, putative [Eimeria acervulina]CDI76313.1 programmed cell death protein, putative [Eimeria acervulina]
MSSEAHVLIGFVGEQVPDDDQTAAEALSKFGGRPVRLSLADSVVNNCARQKRATPYCENKRCLYLFGCHKQTACGRRPDCWTVVRGVVEPPATAQAEKQVRENSSYFSAQGYGAFASVEPSDWLQAAFGYGARASSGNDNCCRKSEEACGPEAASSQSTAPAVVQQAASELMPSFFVRIEHEPPDNSQFDPTGVRARQLQLEYEQRNSIAEAEAYEESPDKVFLKLQKRLSRSPKQAIRYSFGGKPLFIYPVPKGEAAVPPCPHCGSDRVFEMQLVPAAAEEIEKRRHSAGAAPVEWGTVAVFTCRKDCTPTAIYTVEHVIVQEIL